MRWTQEEKDKLRDAWNARGNMSVSVFNERYALANGMSVSTIEKQRAKQGLTAGKFGNGTRYASKFRHEKNPLSSRFKQIEEMRPYAGIYTPDGYEIKFYPDGDAHGVWRRGTTLGMRG